jgi:hypothetical protein
VSLLSACRTESNATCRATSIASASLRKLSISSSRSAAAASCSLLLAQRVFSSSSSSRLSLAMALLSLVILRSRPSMRLRTEPSLLVSSLMFASLFAFFSRRIANFFLALKIHNFKTNKFIK